MLTQLQLDPLLVTALTMPMGHRSQHHITGTAQGFRKLSRQGAVSWRRPLPLLPGHLQGRNLRRAGASLFHKGSGSPGAWGRGVSLTLHGRRFSPVREETRCRVRWRDVACQRGS